MIDYKTVTDASTLFDKQLLFHELCVDQDVWMRKQGYDVKDLQYLRMPIEAMANAASGAGISHSLHLLGLARDQAIFKDGRQLKSVDDLKPIGENWKSLHPLCRWGGDFTALVGGIVQPAPDADHFSVTHQGVK